MKGVDIAAVAHDVNRSYCESIGDHTQVPWAQAPAWQRESAIDGVTFLLRNPDAPVSASHDRWMTHKLEDGWVYGEEKSEAAKTHHCLVPFDELSLEQQVKDHLFHAVVHSLVPHLVERD